MRAYRLTTAGILILIALCAPGAGREHKIQGQIIAFRPAERVVQAPSFVLNSESFLVIVRGSDRSKGQVVRLLYEHFAYSNLKGEFLSEIPTLLFSVQRDGKCDETYKTFEENSPKLQKMGSESPMADPVIFYEPFKTIKPAPNYCLKCYRLKKWHIAD